jgi:hypothetical protein
MAKEYTNELIIMGILIYIRGILGALWVFLGDLPNDDSPVYPTSFVFSTPDLGKEMQNTQRVGYKSY